MRSTSESTWYSLTFPDILGHLEDKKQNKTLKKTALKDNLNVDLEAKPRFTKEESQLQEGKLFSLVTQIVMSRAQASAQSSYLPGRAFPIGI